MAAKTQGMKRLPKRLTRTASNAPLSNLGEYSSSGWNRRRLRTDHFDLYQFHAVTTMDDVQKILAPGGAAETFQRAKAEGKARYLGASAHSMQAAIALMDAFPLDSILFPVNFALYAVQDFGPEALAYAKKKGVARLALKALSRQALEGSERKHPKCWYEPVTERSLAERALRFTLSEDVTSAIPPGVAELFEMSVEIAANFAPLSPAERQSLLAEAKGLRPIFRRG